MPKPCKHSVPVANCRICFLAATEPSYASHWGEPAPFGEGVIPRGSSPCEYRGDQTGDTAPCPPCGARVKLKLFNCTMRGPCTLEQESPGFACCASCPYHTARQPSFTPAEDGGDLPHASKIKRNLLYHIYPVSGNGSWQWNVARLRKSLGIFNGKITVVVATDPPEGRKSDPGGPHCPDGARHFAPCDPLSSICQAFGPWRWDIKFIEVENDPLLREVKTFLPLFESVESTDPNEVTLYAHAKGTTRHRHHQTAWRWTEMLYEIFLDHWPLVEAHLRRWPVTGAFQKLGPGWTREQSNSDWHYSGSWFAFRNRDLFSQPDWRKIDQFWSGIEPYPSQHFPFGQAGCLFHRGSVSGVNMYDAGHLSRIVEPSLAVWKEKNAAWRSPQVWSVDAP